MSDLSGEEEDYHSDTTEGVPDPDYGDGRPGRVFTYANVMHIEEGKVQAGLYVATPLYTFPWLTPYSENHRLFHSYIWFRALIMPDQILTGYQVLLVCIYP
jgi:hypothetical protein